MSTVEKVAMMIEFAIGFITALLVAWAIGVI